ncbi:VOC family protein [Agrobacterium fabrum]|uniref:VOC family protein n=1 Tax=Agrobacterium fabrum TaxID=1176649 RepID=UPI0021588D94|nr:VOC family protein [Agrobacterium fabrum]MCR6727720.1 VOC family protein [Agrobacterium fabrum]
MTAALRPVATEAQARIGHINLSVSDLETSLNFYRDILNMKMTKRIRNEAAFLAFHSYHHDLCINTWNSKGGVPRPKGTTGLYHFAVSYQAFDALQAACHRLLAANVEIDDVIDHGTSLSLYVRDPDQNGIELSWDRPPESWWSADGVLQMGHRQISLQEFLAVTDPLLAHVPET